MPAANRLWRRWSSASECTSIGTTACEHAGLRCWTTDLFERQKRLVELHRTERVHGGRTTAAIRRRMSAQEKLQLPSALQSKNSMLAWAQRCYSNAIRCFELCVDGDADPARRELGSAVAHWSDNHNYNSCSNRCPHVRSAGASGSGGGSYDPLPRVDDEGSRLLLEVFEHHVQRLVNDAELFALGGRTNINEAVHSSLHRVAPKQRSFRSSYFTRQRADGAETEYRQPQHR